MQAQSEYFGNEPFTDALCGGINVASSLKTFIRCSVYKIRLFQTPPPCLPRVSYDPIPIVS